MFELDELKAGQRVRGLSAGSVVTIVAVQPHGDAIVNVIYKSDEGVLSDRLVTADQLAGIELVTGGRWSFDADGAEFKLASEARRIQLAHLFDPYGALESSKIDPLPHQIEAVYERLLPLQPLRFLLADDPGAGKTIMSGLYIRELMIRGDLERCLIIAPGSLVEQWQEELYERFGLAFDIMSRDMVEAARTGNPFIEKRLLIARLDQLSRSDELKAKLELADWDLVIVDEAHKMSAHLYGDEVKRTLRFNLGDLVRDKTRNFLLLTATPHSGSNDDFLLFLSLLDPDRFTGRLRKGAKVPDVGDVMRRYVKESLLTFEGKRLFPERIARTVKYDLSGPERELYDDVSAYVREGMGRAQALEESGDRRRGLAIGFALAALQRRLASSPEAIFKSLKRRREKLEAQLAEARRIGRFDVSTSVAKSLSDPDGFDVDDFDDVEFENLEEEAVVNVMTAETMAELEREIRELGVLERKAAEVRASNEDRKWTELQRILNSEEFRAPGEPRKLIIFSEHRDTLTYLEEKVKTLLGRPEAVVTIHGGVKREDRRRIQSDFRNKPSVKVLIATDAAGEGVNLQRANLMVNYDLPWNPNRLEQRFGRIHRIGQEQTCFLWNMVAHETREGMVFERLFTKIEEQRHVYGEQIYDILGDSEINRSLQELLLEAITYAEDPAVRARADEVIDNNIGARLQAVLSERDTFALRVDAGHVASIHHRMEEALSRKLAPDFLGAFFQAALADLGGRISPRPGGRFEVTRVPAVVRSLSQQVAVGGPLLSAYERVTFDKEKVTPSDESGSVVRAELLSPDHPLMRAVIATVLDRYGETLSRGTTFLDPADDGQTVRILLYLQHTVSDGRMEHGERKVVSQRFQFVEVTADGAVLDPGAEPYINYEPMDDDTWQLVDHLDLSWTGEGVEELGRTWATRHMATPHHEEVREIVEERVAKVRKAVVERLDSEIRYWDARAAELKQKELHGGNPRQNSGRARQRADDLEARKMRRLRELDLEADLVNHAPTIVAAALVVPQGLVDRLTGAAVVEIDPEVALETDRRAVAAVMAVERGLKREPREQEHNNPGFDILSTDPVTGNVYQIEVKGHRPANPEVKVRARQVRQAKQNPDRFRLAIVSVPDDSLGEPTVYYFLRPFESYDLHFAQTYVPLNVNEMITQAVEPQ